MNAVIDAVSNSTKCGAVCTSDFVPLFSNLPTSSRLSLLSAGLYGSIVDDDEEDSIPCTQSSPVSVRTLLKESPSPGSSEFPSILSEKCSSRGYSGDSFSGGFCNSEMTDNERSISECSLSPTQRSASSHNTISPLSSRHDELPHATGISNFPSLHCHSNSTVAHTKTVISTEFHHGASSISQHTTAACTANISCVAFTSANTLLHKPNCAVNDTQCYQKTAVLSSNNLNYSSGNNLNPSVTFSHASRTLFSSLMNPTDVSPDCEGHLKSNHPTRSNTPKYFTDRYCRSPLAPRDNRSTICSYSANRSLEPGSHVTFNSQPASSYSIGSSDSQHPCNIDFPANTYRQPVLNTDVCGSSHDRHTRLLHVSSGCSSSSSITNYSPLTSFPSYSESCRKRPPSMNTSPRVAKRRNTSQGSSASDAVPAKLFQSDLTRHHLHEPVLSFPVSVYPPSPAPSTHKRSGAWFSSNENDSQGSLSHVHSTGKYSTFPLCLNSIRRLAPSELRLFQLLTTASNQRTAENLLGENFLLNALKQAGVRNNQCHYYRSPSSPSACSKLLCDVFTNETEMKCTTPPLSRNREAIVLDSETHKNPVSSSAVPSKSNRYPEISVFSSTWSLSKPMICSHCAMQITEPSGSVEWTSVDHDKKIVFCSALCLDYYRNSGSASSFQTTCDVSSKHPCLFDTTLSPTTSTSSYVLLRPMLTKPTKVLNRQPLNPEKFSRRKRFDHSIRNKFRPIQRSAPWRWTPIRWRHFSKRDRHGLFVGRNLSDQAFPPGSVTDSSRLANLAPACSGNLASELTRSTADSRVCILCHSTGDSLDDVSGRLLPYSYERWLHLNCILWCYDTYETVSGGIVGAPQAIRKASETRCAHCNRTGAGLPCFHPDCPDVYHLPCAFSIHCSFHADRSMFCPLHSTETTLPPLKSLAAHRRVYICRDESSQVADAILLSTQQNERSKDEVRDTSVRLRVGGLILHNIGQLLPDQLSSGFFHSNQFIYPVGYHSTRIFWSYRRVTERCCYHCRIDDGSSLGGSQQSGGARFLVSVEEFGEPVEIFEHTSCSGVWKQIIDKINTARQASGLNLLRIVPQFSPGETLYGLNEPRIVRALESLPGVEHLSNYTFKFGRLQLIKEMPLVINPTGCARSEPKLRTHIRRAHGEATDSQHPSLIRNAIATHHSCMPSRLSVGSPMYLASAFCATSKSQQYRRLRTEWRANVVLGRSRIQGLGLYAARSLSKHVFIIEYLGELIRNEVGNKRERLYEAQNRGVYMFRVDDDSIVDATMCGGLARYINHSCEPNCSAEVLTCDGGNHIIIIANRDIHKGEELTYDYKFDVEEERGDRIPCLCGSPVCRKWMN